MSEPIRATIPSDILLTWESQVCQYPDRGEPGLSYFRGDIGDGEHVDCLLYRDGTGNLVGILNHYPVDILPWEKAGNFNIWVRKDWQRKGVATLLFMEAKRRYGVGVNGQRFTREGAQFATALVERGLA